MAESNANASNPSTDLPAAVSPPLLSVAEVGADLMENPAYLGTQTEKWSDKVSWIEDPYNRGAVVAIAKESGSVDPFDFAIIGRISPNGNNLKAHGDFNPDFANPFEKAKVSFQLSSPMNVFALDSQWDCYIDNLLRLKDNGAPPGNIKIEGILVESPYPSIPTSVRLVWHLFLNREDLAQEHRAALAEGSVEHPYRVGSYTIDNWPVHPDYVQYRDAIAEDFVIRPLPVYTRGMARMLDPTEYSRIVGCTVLASYCVRQYVIRNKGHQKAVFTAYLNSMEILERPPAPPGPSKRLSSPLSRKVAAIREAKQKGQPPDDDDSAQTQHSPDNGGVTDRNAAAGKGEGTSRKRKR
ncbi:hypothetical protein FRC02_001104 [Tulasnella sp. 418]|nr:hypothetical protein FRC02_001104 [Tulasnella sp. 418]